MHACIYVCMCSSNSPGKHCTTVAQWMDDLSVPVVRSCLIDVDNICLYQNSTPTFAPRKPSLVTGISVRTRIVTLSIIGYRYWLLETDDFSGSSSKDQI